MKPVLKIYYKASAHGLDSCLRAFRISKPWGQDGIHKNDLIWFMGWPAFE
jgi:hypothetical protein